MKRIFFIIAFTVLVLVSTACSSKEDSNIVSSKSTVENKDKSSNIEVLSPMTLSDNNLYLINGENQYLRLKMVKGKYYEDWNPGAYMGTLWEGYFIIELADNVGNTLTQTDLSKIYKEPLIFNSSFKFQFDDYNGDGDLDFTMGQYALSNGYEYKLFTLRKDRKIEQLSVKGFDSLFISTTSGRYSIKLTKVNNITFKKEYYDNSKGKSFEEAFRWNGKEFIKIR